MKKNNTWNIRRLVDETIVPWTQRIILKIVGFLDTLRKKPLLSKMGVFNKNRSFPFCYPLLISPVSMLIHQKILEKHNFCLMT